MNLNYTIAIARPRDLRYLSAIERAAAKLLQGYAPESVIDESTDESDFIEAQEHGRLWVALMDDKPVGFAHVEMLTDDLPHLEEIDVLPAYGRRGIGTALVRAVLEWVTRMGYEQMTLTTFREVPWNMPFYLRLGFREVPRDAWGPEVAAVVADESARGLDAAARVVMAYSSNESPDKRFS